MNKKEIVFSILKHQEEPQLMSAIKDIMEENSAHNLNNFDHKYWDWQYKKLPTHKTDVFVGRDSESNILAYYHVPYYTGKYNGGETNYAMIQDVAVSNQLRGQGLFSKIATFANQHIDDSQIKIIYTFPNHKSIHTFVKYNNFTVLSSLNAYILPLNIAQLIKSKLSLGGIENIFGKLFDLFWKVFSIFSFLPKKYKIERHYSITENIAEVFEKYSYSFDFGLKKDKTYLDWRFIEKENQKNHIYTISDNDGITKACAILKEDEIKGIPCLLLMDLAYTLDDGDEYFLRLMSNLRNNHQKYFGGKIGLIFTSLNVPIERKFYKIGFFKIPQKINPRPLNLLIRSNEGNPQIYNKEKWNVTLCDWDVF